MIIMCLFSCSTVSMQQLFTLKSSPFFNSFESDFLDGETPENESDYVKQVYLFIYNCY